MTLVREGKQSDLPALLNLVRELAIYEKAEQEVSNTVAQMTSDGFGEKPVFGFFVAEVDERIVGMAVWYFRFSTWKGKRLWLEDIIVSEPFRGKGIGKNLFDAVMKKSIQENCTGMMWQVLDWNEPSIEFYKRYGSKLDPEWINCHLDRSQIEEHLKKKI
ncbi:MAG: GNAT family N-acetyltransferase [Bacteroidetes bacterium]|nr:GNAT family N-acetyltransferase [Bacteroidota bacterium]